uniref:Uncharacterized protein n=1 Tax=Timema poppense TaxID=170557 RepID=A0A7R9GZV7_TIMPO|nr:unnamed protein product [Timema poppensis]
MEIERVRTDHRCELGSRVFCGTSCAFIVRMFSISFFNVEVFVVGVLKVSNKEFVNRRRRRVKLKNSLCPRYLRHDERCEGKAKRHRAPRWVRRPYRISGRFHQKERTGIFNVGKFNVIAPGRDFVLVFRLSHSSLKVMQTSHLDSNSAASTLVPGKSLTGDNTFYLNI